MGKTWQWMTDESRRGYMNKWANGRSVKSKYSEKIEARTGSYENQAPVKLHDGFNWECN